MNPLGVTITIPESAAIRLYGLHMLLASHHFCFDGETELQDGIESLLNESKISFEREFRLNEQDRPDFFLKSESSNLVIEVKIHDPLGKSDPAITSLRPTRRSSRHAAGHHAPHAPGCPAGD